MPGLPAVDWVALAGIGECLVQLEQGEILAGVGRGHGRGVADRGSARAGVHGGGNAERVDLGHGQAPDRPDAGAGDVVALRRRVAHVGEPGGQQVVDEEIGGVVRSVVAHGDGELDHFTLARRGIVHQLAHVEVGVLDDVVVGQHIALFRIDNDPGAQTLGLFAPRHALGKIEKR